MGVDVENILEDIRERVYNECGECAEDYLMDVTRKEKEELEEKLNKELQEWLVKNKLEPGFYSIVKDEWMHL